MPFAHNMLHTDSSENCPREWISDCLFVSERSGSITSDLPSWSWGCCLQHFILMTACLHKWVWDCEPFIVSEQIDVSAFKNYFRNTEWQRQRGEKKINPFLEANPLILLLSPYAIRQGRGSWRGWLSAGVRAAPSWQAAPDGCCQGWQSSLDSQLWLEHSVGSWTRLAEPHHCQGKQDFV